MNKINITLIVNQKEFKIAVNPNARLLDVLRDELNLKGTKEGCGIGECGACTVIVDGENINSCLVLAAAMDGKSITTVEGLKTTKDLHPLQQSFIDNHALQCGFCTPGLLMSSKALLDKTPSPSREEIRVAISGNLCRCTGYDQIINAIEEVAKDKGGVPSNEEKN